VISVVAWLLHCLRAFARWEAGPSKAQREEPPYRRDAFLSRLVGAALVMAVFAASFASKLELLPHGTVGWTLPMRVLDAIGGMVPVSLLLVTPIAVVVTVLCAVRILCLLPYGTDVAMASVACDVFAAPTPPGAWTVEEFAFAPSTSSRRIGALFHHRVSAEPAVLRSVAGFLAALEHDASARPSDAGRRLSGV
jgi:hypothetical protein